MWDIILIKRTRKIIAARGLKTEGRIEMAGDESPLTPG